MSRGIVIGADASAESLIPWWWERYSSYCKLPVTIVDFGMSKKQAVWCRARMEVIPFSSERLRVEPQTKISKEHLKLWKKQYKGPIWTSREAWFKKPGACLLSPYDVSVWIDLDCEVCGPLDSLFAEWDDTAELAICREEFRSDLPVVYNSGVILFRKKAPFLSKWNELCHSQNRILMGDQDVLLKILLEGTTSFKELPTRYNWLMLGGIQPGIVIAHWASGWGKEYIVKFGGLHALLTQG